MLAERVIEWTQEWKQQGLEEGRKEGLEEGRKEGRKEGEALILQELLTVKFGSLDAATQARLATADSGKLLIWGRRLLTAENLAEVFGDKPAG